MKTSTKRKFQLVGILALAILTLKSLNIHFQAGKFGCVPKSSLFLTENNDFFEFKIPEPNAIDPTKMDTFYYIPFQTIYVHRPGDVPIEYSPGYFRSESSVLRDWNTEKDNANCFLTRFGIGVCSLNEGMLYRNGLGMWYFKDAAFLCGGNQKWPVVINPNDSCEPHHKFFEKLLHLLL